MAKTGTYSREMYRDTSEPIHKRLNLLEKHIKDSLICELRVELERGNNPNMGTSDHEFTWGRGSSKQKTFLELERQRQSLMLVEVGGRLGFREDQCFDLLPDRFPTRPSSRYRRRGLNTPLLVPKFPGVSWPELIQAMDRTASDWPSRYIWISDKLKEQVDDVREWKDPQGFTTPDKPYSTWVKIPRSMSNFYPRPRLWLLSPEQARIRMPKDARGATHWDGAALAFLRYYDAKPMRHDWMSYYDLIGSEVGSDSVVSIPKSFATVEPSGLDVVPVNFKPVYFRGRKKFITPPRQRFPIVCSREVATKS